MESSFIAHPTGSKLAHTELVVLCMLKRAINCSTTNLWVFDCAISKILGFYTLLVSPVGSVHNVMYTVCNLSNPFLKNNRRGRSANAKAPLIGTNVHRRFPDDIHLRASLSTNADGLANGVPFFCAMPCRSICNNHEDKLAVHRRIQFWYTFYHRVKEISFALLGRAK